MNKFNIDNIDFNKTIVIEASAGTGKTYNISGIYEKLIKKGVDVKEILVVTFTDNATNELRERIKSNLKCFVNKEMHNESAEYKRAKNALRMFDEANIFTIHGFCRKTLIENSFESKTDFDAEIGSDEIIINELIYDFYRDNFIDSTTLTASFLKKNLSINNILKLPNHKIVNSSINIKLKHSKLEFDNILDISKNIIELSEKMLNQINGKKEEIIKLIYNTKLNGNIYNKNLSKYLDNIENDLLKIKANKHDVFETKFDKLELFTIQKMESSKTKNSVDIPQNVFFEYAQNLLDKFKEFNSKIIDLKDIFISNFVKYIRKKLVERKKKDGIITFDDMIQQTYENLDSETFREIISKKYKAVLVDEFQDTDIMQYTIFKKLFFGSKNKTCFMIGDPKQSIYKFRGADIYSYIQARKNSDFQYTLDKNFRSEKGIIESINTIFSGESPFYNKELEYTKVLHPGDEKENEEIFYSEIKEFQDNFCTINFIKDGEKNKSVNKDDSLTFVINNFLHDITKLLDNANKDKVKIGNRNFKNSDIGVIVRSNYEAKEIKNQLTKLNIPSVIYSNESVYSSIIASDMKDIFIAIKEPNSFSSVKKALGTSMIFEREVINCNDNKISEYTEFFVEANSIYNKWGISRAIAFLDKKFFFIENLLKRDNSERNITNFKHLEELIVLDIYNKGMSISAFIKEFIKKINEGKDKENEQKIESDENAVRIISIHKSKGLQYKVVFYLSAWQKCFNIDKVEYPIAHNKITKKIELALINDRKESIKKNQLEDEFEESIRLFYVAVTRAVSRLFVYIPDYMNNHLSPANYLFNYSFMKKKADDFDIHSKNSNIKSDDYINSLNKLAKECNNSIKINIIDKFFDINPLNVKKSEKKDFEYRKFKQRNIENRRTTSFSGLIFNIEHEKVEYQKDSLLEDRTEKTVFDLPKGPLAGTAVHEILENISFNSNSEIIRNNVEIVMKKYGWNEEWIFEKLSENIHNVLNTEIFHNGEKFRLCEINHKDIVKESFFVFPVNDLKSEHLRNIYNKYKDKCPDIFNKLDFEGFSGYISGFIDLMFRIDDKYFILDWKTNSLGYSYEDYSKENLNKAMKANYYNLQYYIYSEAIQKYLSLKLKDYSKEKNWGGVYYLFTRGIKPKCKTGIFYDNLSSEVFEEFSNIFKLNDENNIKQHKTT
ncbi:MAG: exodeoxyribonuclease V subunit beta [Candidatus Muirbacterium halophilum]|nr:exodeoxyribonuclease V subunit beta [Candidatus Muirbacterium halophilum]MCK9476743.1 exodeoxyribonuclease V subunit beta [Candidatus Muirbacterium halophilum]